MPKLRRSPEDESRRDGPDIIESLERGLRLLQLFAAAPRPATLSDMAKAADLPRATARRILHTLAKMGFVEGDGKLFSLTPRVLSLATAYLSSNQVVAVLQPMMDRVAAQAQEVCSLAILHNSEAVFIARASPARVFSAGIDIGYRLPAFCTAVGRVLLSRLENEALADFLEAVKPEAMTPFTITDKEILPATIISDRSKGYSLVDREAELGFRSISVPVRRYDSAIIAAVNIGAHVDRISTGEMIDRFLPLLNTEVASVRSLLL